MACTHGPDPAPPAVDVRKPRSVAALRADTFGAGGQPATADVAGALNPCIGDGSSGDRVQVIYARPADRPDRFAQVKSLIAGWAAQASGVFDDSAAQTGGSRLIRFVTLPSPDCELKIDSVTLSSAADDSFGNTIDELHQVGYNRSDRKYMVFMDANVLCGIGEVMNDDRPGEENANNGVPGIPGSIGRTDAGCWGLLDDEHSVEAHELIHNLGGVQLSAPHSSGGWHCIDESDTECYSDPPNFPTMQFVCPGSEERLLDCNDDDYFNTDPAPGSYLATHWDVANSDFLVSGGEPVHPPNDAFAASQPLSGAEDVRLGDSSDGATKETGEPDHAGNPGGASIWYSWTAPESGPAVVDTAQSSYDTLLAVYTGASVDSLTEIGSNDDVAPGSDTSSRVSFEAETGQTYRIAVDGFSGASGTVRLLVSGTVTRPPNDAFASAQPLSGSDVSRESDTNRKATKEAGEPAHAGNPGGASIWYSWTAPASGPIVVETAGSDFDTLLAAYVGSSVDSLTEVAFNDDVSGLQTSRMNFTASSGMTYRIAVDGYNGSEDAATGKVKLFLTQSETGPSNDSFATPTPLFGTDASRHGDTNVGATKEPAEPSHAGNPGGASVWYSWTAPADGPVVVDTAGSDFDSVLAVYTGASVGSLSAVASNDNVNPSSDQTSRVEFTGASGQAYRVAVDGFNDGGGVSRGSLGIRVLEHSPARATVLQSAALPPQTRIVGGPRGRVRSRRATFWFEADEPATFACRIGARAWSSCTSPKRYRRLSLGRHVFRVMAQSALGLVDPTPAVRRFRLVK